MFDIPADIFFRYSSDRFYIIGMVPQLPFPKLVSYFRKTFKKFPAGDPLQVFHDRLKGWITELGEKRKELLVQKAAEEATLLPNLLMKYMEIRKEERKDWTRAGQNRGTSQLSLIHIFHKVGIKGKNQKFPRLRKV